VPAPEESAGVVWSRDDFDGAIARAKQRGRLVFVDAWAEWCHTCLSMEAVVLSDPSLVSFADQYEFVAVDTENPKNAAFVGRFAMDTWPTFFVIRPDDLSLLGFWPGAASVTEMRQFLEQSLDAAQALEAGNAPPYLRHFLAARSAHSVGDDATAVKEYERAYGAMPDDWPRRSELLFGYIAALAKERQFSRCAEIGKRHLDEVTGAAKPAQFAQRYFTCLGQLRTPDRDAEVERALTKLASLARSPTPDMSFDDRVDALLMLSTAYRMMGRKEEAARVLSERLQLAEQAAKDAKDPSEARAFDRVRALSYLELGRSDEALALLAESERAHPHGYATPALLAEVLERLGRQDEGLEALERAVKNAEGPRRCDYLEDEADWLHRLGRYDAEVSVLERLLSERRKLRGAAQQQKLERTQQRLQVLRARIGG
jgi:tetratricopeptide (TPR) repeat protein